METDPIRVCELIVGLPDVKIVGVDDAGVDQPLPLHIETLGPRPACERSGTSAEVKDRPRVELADLPALVRPVRTVWHKHRWRRVENDEGVDRFDQSGAVTAFRVVEARE